MKRMHLASSMALAALLATSQAWSDPAPKDTDPWLAAEKSFREYVAPLLETARSRHRDPTIQDAEFRSELLRKHLPDFRVYVKTGPFDETSRIFVLGRDGKIFDLGDGLWKGDESGILASEVTDFLKSRGIPVRSGAEAIEAARLTEEIQGAPSYIAFLQINTNGFKVFDSQFISRHYGPPTDWKYTAEPRTGGWTVRREYVGPPAMVQVPPVYEIDVDEQKRFSGLRDLRRLPNPR